MKSVKKDSATVRNNRARTILESAIKENKDPVVASLLNAVKLKLS